MIFAGGRRLSGTPVPAAVFGLLLAFLAWTLAGCGERTPPADAPPNISEVTTVTPREGRVPDFAWKEAGGSDRSFDGTRGKLTLVNFWATWCGPCKKELPDLIALHKEYGARGFSVVGVATDRTPNAAELVSEFIKTYDIPYQILLSTQEMEDAFGNVRMMPTSFLVDADGNIVKTLVGIRTKEQLEELILPLL